MIFLNEIHLVLYNLIMGIANSAVFYRAESYSEWPKKVRPRKVPKLEDMVQFCSRVVERQNSEFCDKFYNGHSLEERVQLMARKIHKSIEIQDWILPLYSSVALIRDGINIDGQNYKYICDCKIQNYDNNYSIYICFKGGYIRNNDWYGKGFGYQNWIIYGSNYQEKNIIYFNQNIYP